MKVYKYPLMSENIQKIAMPTGAQVLEAGLDEDNRICVWAIIDPTEKVQEYHRIFAMMTGETFPETLEKGLINGEIVSIGTVKWQPSPRTTLIISVFWQNPAEQALTKYVDDVMSGLDAAEEESN